MKYLYFSLFSLMLFGSCTGQKPAPLHSEVKSMNNELKESCKSADFHSTPFEHNKMLSLFECAKWNKKFPNLYSGIERIPGQQWNHIGLALSEAFYGNKEKINKFNKYISVVKTNDGFHEYEKLINAVLKKSTTIETLSQIFSDEKNKEHLIKGLGLFDIEDTILKKEITTLNHLLEIINPHKEKLSEMLTKLKGREFDLLKIQLFDQFANASIKLKDPKEVEILKNFIFNPKMNMSIMKNWVNKKEDSYPRFKYFYQLATEDFSLLQKDLSLILTKNQKGIVCKSLNPQIPFVVYPSVEMESKLNVIRNGSHEEFLESLVDGLSKNLSFANFCAEGGRRNDVQEYIDSNYRFLDKLISFSENVNNFEFLKRAQQTIEVNDSNKWWVLDFLKGDLFGSLSYLLKFSFDSEFEDTFLKAYFDVIKNLNHDEYQLVSDIVQILEKQDNRKSLNAWFEVWLNLDEPTKISMIEILEEIIKSDVQFLTLKKMNEALLEIYPEFITDLKKYFLNKNKEKSILSLEVILNALKEPATQEELTQFLSYKNLFKIFDLLATSEQNVNSNSHTSSINVPFAQTEQMSSNPQIVHDWIMCFQDVRELSKEYNYYIVVNKLPQICQNRIKTTGLAGSIFEWMENSNNLFKKFAGYELHKIKGIWSPEMLHLLFGYATIVGSNYHDRFHSTDYTLVYTELSKVINKPLQRLKINVAFDLFSKFVLKMDGFNTWAKDIVSTPEKELRDNFQLLIKKSKVDLNRKGTFPEVSYQCNNLVSLPVNIRCVNNSQIKQALIKLDVLLKKKNNGSEFTLRDGLLEFLHPTTGIKIPSRTEKKKINLSEILRFVFDLGQKSTEKIYTNHSRDYTESLSASNITRVETVIRDIEFSNNFYGAYFMNVASQAYNYQEKIYSLKTLMNFMETSSGLLRGINFLPPESRWMLKNVKQSYLSLAEVAEEHTPYNLSNRKYNDFVQALLTVINKSSAIEAQDFNAIRKPQPQLVENHSGRMLTELSKLSVFTRLSTYLSLKIKNNEKSFFESPDLAFLNKHLFHNIDLTKIKKLIAQVLELKNNKNELLWIEGAMNSVESIQVASLEKIALIEELMTETLILVSDPRVKIETTNAFINILEQVLPYHQKFSDLSSLDASEEELISSLQNLRALRADTKKLNLIYKMVNYAAPWLNKLKLTNEDIDLIVRFIKTQEETDTSLKISKILESFSDALVDNRFNLTPVIKTLSVMVDENRTFELKDLLRLLREKKDGRFYLDIALDELFIHAKDQVISFLRDTFPALTLPRTQVP